MKLRIFIADVDDVLADLLHASLTDTDFELRSVDRGSLALMELKDFEPHVALLNANLKGISGYDLCEIIKQDKDLAAARVVLIDSEEAPLEQDRARAVGFDAHVRRPYSVDSISALLEGLGEGGFQENQQDDFFVGGSEEDSPEPSDIFELESRDEVGDKDSLLDQEDPRPVTLEMDDEEPVRKPEPESDHESPPSANPQRTVTVDEILASETGRRLVREIVAELSDEVVREVAWQVVPDLAEQIIEQTIEKLKTSKAGTA